MQKKHTVYFNRPGPDNTQECISVVMDQISAFSYKHLVVASTSGDTGMAFAERLEGSDTHLVVVTHSHGFREPNSIELSPDKRALIESKGASVYTGTMITHSLETSLAMKFGGVYPTLLVAQSLRIMGEGVKVCCEMVMMTADAGLIPEGEEILTVAGTGRGADTVTVIKSAASKRFLDLRILEIPAKPR